MIPFRRMAAIVAVRIHRFSSLFFCWGLLLPSLGVDQENKERCLVLVFHVPQSVWENCGQHRWMKSSSTGRSEYGLIISNGFIISGILSRKAVFSHTAGFGMPCPRSSHLSWWNSASAAFFPFLTPSASWIVSWLTAPFCVNPGRSCLLWFGVGYPDG